MRTLGYPVLASTLLGLLVAGCGASAGEADIGESESEVRTTYNDLFVTLDGQDLERWVTVRRALVDGFDRICGDTICGGDYSNLATVRLTCSSTSKARKMKDCAWVLGGSIDHVDGRTGKITNDARAFTCKVPVAGTAKSMLDALEAAGDQALHTPLPATGTSFYDALVDCFDGVVGAPIPEAEKTFYVELGDHLWNQSPDAGAAWQQTTRTLADNFDDICGDTFCEGQYSAITALRFACSVNVSTSRVSHCTWTFAAAEMSVGRRGAIATETATQTCTIDVGAQESALRAALAVDEPLYAKLPGKTTSIYDALIGCL